MLIWINGTFGVGKTTTSRNLVRLLPGSREFDPEWVGFLLRHHLAADHPVADFQDYPSWRRLVPIVIDEVSRVTNQHVIAAQSVLVEDYWNEITAGLNTLGHEPYHVLLDADAATLHARIDADYEEPAEIRPWRHDHVETYEAARPWLVSAADLCVDTTGSDASSVADLVISAVSSRGLDT